jgi:hypothetical protein
MPEQFVYTNHFRAIAFLFVTVLLGFAVYAINQRRIESGSHAAQQFRSTLERRDGLALERWLDAPIQQANSSEGNGLRIFVRSMLQQLPEPVVVSSMEEVHNVDSAGNPIWDPENQHLAIFTFRVKAGMSSNVPTQFTCQFRRSRIGWTCNVVAILFFLNRQSGDVPVRVARIEKAMRDAGLKRIVLPETEQVITLERVIAARKGIIPPTEIWEPMPQ